MREAFLLDLLTQAARSCRDQGRRLVLVLDGLDEDRSVTACPDAHSIASLLPADPPAGMRIIIAGRPNPPIPDDVPDFHPLRRPGIIRDLAPSPYARNLQRLSRAELRRLLSGTQLEQDMLGLVTAARGGLTASDLSDLTTAPLWKIEDIFQTVTGRTFTNRPSTWQPDNVPEGFLLGHEELQATAASYIGQHTLATYRDRLHAWAGNYKARDWPAETPEYLLLGYYQLLVATGDLPRMVTCATDSARHDRMLSLSGADDTALYEPAPAWTRSPVRITPMRSQPSAWLITAINSPTATTTSRPVCPPSGYYWANRSVQRPSPAP